MEAKGQIPIPLHHTAALALAEVPAVVAEAVVVLVADLVNLRS